MEKIEVLKDTNIVQDNTADSLRILVSTETSIDADTYVAQGGETIDFGKKTVTTPPSDTTLSQVKEHLAGIPARRDALNKQLADLDLEEADAQKQLTDLSAAVDSAIADILTREGAVDSRTKVSEEVIP